VLDPSAPEIATDAERLRLALVNLIVNARQAVAASETARASLAEAAGGARSAGALTATARDTAAVTVTTRATDERVTITIMDSGNGIDADDQPRIFDPYFTTKRGGTGLGLPIAKNIVEGLGGTLTVASREGRGTELRIELPGTTARQPTIASAS
jgi:signal transduction histidine kinase